MCFRLSNLEGLAKVGLYSMISVCFRLSNLVGLEKVGLYINDLNMFQTKQFRGFGEGGTIYQ